MSLNKTLDRLFDEIRREAKRSPGFADRLDAVLRLHDSRRDVPDDVIETAARESSAVAGGADEPEGDAPPAEAHRPLGQGASNRADRRQQPPALNPAGLYKREGEAALAEALSALDAAALRALIAEHNLDTSGVTEAMDRDGLAEHVLAQAKRRAERDDKMFDY